MVLCVLHCLFTISPDLPDSVLNNASDGDTLVSFSLLLIRYTFYVFFILISSGKTLKNRGCCENKEQWEIPEVDAGTQTSKKLMRKRMLSIKRE